MNDKAKAIAKYALATLGGACLGVALLGGLSYCATSPAREKTSEVNTILTDRSPKGLSGTTTNGGYDYYKLSLNTAWDTANPGVGRAFVFDVDLDTYDLTMVTGLDGMNGYTYFRSEGLSGWTSVTTAINNAVNLAKGGTIDEVRFLAFYTYCPMWSPYQENYFIAYYSFILPEISTVGLEPLPFILTSNWTYSKALRTNENYWVYEETGNPTYMVNYEVTDYFIIDTTHREAPIERMVFQDVESYYKELGYTTGYNNGYSAGFYASPGGVATDNVFSLFTDAFTAVGAFFNLQIFGFLPLYWFFLSPLFIALITLLLRMVKH